MKKVLLIFLFLLSLSHLMAQTERELSPEEKAKREKNIQAGNPFKQYGYTPKIATLSKGKYLEFHDLDSVVQIGSFAYHVKNREIVGYTAYDTIYPESTLRPELMSRWISPDPLSEEFPSWSPYNFVYNNPLRFIDPTGLAADTVNVNNRLGQLLFKLDDGKKVVTNLTAMQVYQRGIQWFEPEADNYMPITLISDNLFTSNSAKHFSWDDISKFSRVSRSNFSFRQKGDGDWKESKEGADGFYLVTVDGMPYWSDAIGQIPFAINYFKQVGDVQKVLDKGIEYGEGKILGGNPEQGNIYDKYFLLRGALFQWRYSLLLRAGGPSLSPTTMSEPIDIQTAKFYGIK